MSSCKLVIKDEVNVKFENLDLKWRQKLANKFKYQVPYAYHLPAVKLGRWDGKISFHEFKTFIWYNGKPQAMRSYHDDLVISLAIACWVRDTALQVNQRDVQYKKAMLDGMFMKTTKMLFMP
jgi:hypothetical protein